LKPFGWLSASHADPPAMMVLSSLLCGLLMKLECWR
jgi:hypothetical protein